MQIIACCVGIGAVQAQPVALDLPAILSLSDRPWLDADGFAADLAMAVPGFQPRPFRGRDPAPDDPFFWTIRGHFADPPVPHIPGGVVSCSRYGLVTRDVFATFGFSDRATFRLFQQVQPAPDDAEVWPEEAIARLSCRLAWDDSRAVDIIAVRDATAAVVDLFEEVTLPDVDRTRAGNFGPDGYQVLGRDGLRDVVVFVESAQIVRTLNYQTLTFRAFLLNGGM